MIWRHEIQPMIDETQVIASDRIQEKLSDTVQHSDDVDSGTRRARVGLGCSRSSLTWRAKGLPPPSTLITTSSVAGATFGAHASNVAGIIAAPKAGARCPARSRQEPRRNTSCRSSAGHDRKEATLHPAQHGTILPARDAAHGPLCPRERGGVGDLRRIDADPLRRNRRHIAADCRDRLHQRLSPVCA
jgi:hypothetical protein